MFKFIIYAMFYLKNLKSIFLLCTKWFIVIKKVGKMQRKKELGSFYTPQNLADWVVERIISQKTVHSVLEPSCGDGVFLTSLFKLSSTIPQATVVDIDTDAIVKVCKRFPKINIINNDFLFLKIDNKFDLVIGNPPYISKKNILPTQMEQCRKIHVENGLADREVSNIWTAFLIKSCSLVKSSGILSLVLPAEFLQVKYAQEIRNFIVHSFDRIEILSFRNFRFENTEQNTIVLFAYKKTEKSKGVFFKEINSINELDDNIIFEKSELGSEMKWTANCLNAEELAVLNKVKQNPLVNNIDYYCSAVAGIVTAANSFFILNKEMVAKFKLKKYVVPIIQKGLFVNGNVCFNSEDFCKLYNSNTPCFLLNLSSVPESKFSLYLRDYLNIGYQKQIDKRYKCLQRTRWFDVPSIWSSEGFFFKRSDKYPKMLVNQCNVYITDSGYRIKMKKMYHIENLTFSFYNTFTLLMAEIMGRSYGGGVLELTPNEFKSLPIVYFDEVIDFNKFSVMFSNKKDIVDILKKNDEIILKNRLKLTDKEVCCIQNAYLKLKNRRGA